MSSYHHGISPSLVSLLTEQEEQRLPSRLTVSMLPGRFATRVARNKAKVSARHPINKHMLTCRKCGRKGGYDLGLVVVDSKIGDCGNDIDAANITSKGMADYIQCTGYFRCKHCNGAGEWELPTNFDFLLMSASLIKLAGGSGGWMEFGKIEIFDGFRPRWATDGESHLLQRIRTEGQDSYLWNRLGNLYLSGGRPELAMAAFEQSIQLDSGQLESHMSIGHILYDIGAAQDAAYHLRQVLVHARQYNKLNKTSLRNVLAMALKFLLDLHLSHPETISFLPTREEYKDNVEFSGERVLDIKEFCLEFDHPESFYPLADLFMGIQQADVENGRSKVFSTEKDMRERILTKRRKVGRNEPCPCGSGKKYKRCCGT